MPSIGRVGGFLLPLVAAAVFPLWAQVSKAPRPVPAPDTTQATEPLGGRQVRRGLWLAGGLGYGSLEGSRGGGTGGATGNLEAGWTVSRTLLLGIGTTAWTRSGLGETGRLGLTAGSVDVRARWYPSEMAGGFFVTGGGGIGFFRLHDRLAVPSNNTQTGWSLHGGLGYDFRVAAGLSITPAGTWSAMRTEENGDHMAGDVWQVGVGLTLH